MKQRWEVEIEFQYSGELIQPSSSLNKKETILLSIIFWFILYCVFFFMYSNFVH